MNTSHPPPRKMSTGEELRQKIVVGVAGGSAAGKTTLCQNINRQMAFDRNFKVEIISLDSFYKNVDKTEVDITQYNFDHPNALDFDMAYKTLVNLIESNEPVPVPQYSFIEHARLKEPTFVGPANIIFFQGLMAFYDKRIRDLLTYKIFINCDDDIRLCRRLKRDTTERGRSVISVLEQYNKFVKNAFRDFILPSIVYADIIIPGFRNNRVSVDFIVQHIKNMARRITFKERAVKTRTFIFGQAQIYDLQASNSNSYDIKVTTEQESFLVFPTSNEHRKQLQFFLTCLLSQIFSDEYFKQIYLHQFMKVLKVLLSQLMILKNFRSQKMEIFPVEHIREVLSSPPDAHPIKVIFYPVALREEAKEVLNLIKPYIQKHSNTTFIILNAFCDMNVPQMIYRLKMSNVIMVNLFVLANEKRFREIMSNNIEVVSDNFDWFVHNQFISTQGCKSIAREFNFHQKTQEQMDILRYENEVRMQLENDRPKTKDIQENLQSVAGQSIKQYKVYPQEHQNLCGFHALSTILCLVNNQSIIDKKKFVENYNKMAQILGKVNFQPLERHSIPILLQNKLFEKVKNVGVLFFSFKYIQNTEQQNENLQNLFNDFKQGIHSHYVLVRVKRMEIAFFDSMNNSLRDIWNGTVNSFSEEQKNEKSFKDVHHHLENLKQALDILVDLRGQKTTVNAVMLEKILEDIVTSWDLVKNNPAEIENWIANEYPREVLLSQLIRPYLQKKVKLSEKHTSMLKEWGDHPRIKELLKQKQIQI